MVILYASGIIFRIAALTLTASYFRPWSIVPIFISICETWILVGFCIRHDVWLMFFVALSNIGITNIGMIKHIDRMSGVSTEARKLKLFVKISNTVTFLHHIITLSVILALLKTYPKWMGHWVDGTLTPAITPCNPHYDYVFFSVLAVGFLNLALRSFLNL